MNFSEKLKTLRKKAGLSQEQLAEKLNVSRQAITKWETDAGIPDIENLKSISALFSVSIDELLANETHSKSQSIYLYESVTEYDIAEQKRFDMKFGGVKNLKISGYNGEKIRIRLASNTLPDLQADYKVKIDDTKKRIDVDLIRKNGATEAAAKEAIDLFVDIPSPYIGKIECEAAAKTAEISRLECGNIELDLKTQQVILSDIVGTVEINCNLDLIVECDNISGEIDLNQLSATSKIYVGEMQFSAVAKGIGTSISYEENGKKCQPFDTPDSDNIIELNGIKSELVICKNK